MAGMIAYEIGPRTKGLICPPYERQFDVSLSLIGGAYHLRWCIPTIAWIVRTYVRDAAESAGKGSKSFRENLTGAEKQYILK